MGSKTRTTEAAAGIDTALKALFDALAGAPTPPAILGLVDRLEQAAEPPAADSGAALRTDRRAS